MSNIETNGFEVMRDDAVSKQLLGPILFAALPYVAALQGMPEFSYDGMIYRVWTESFQSQFMDGVFYPRWLPDLNRGLGSPTFYFYPPLAFFFSTLFRVLSFGLVSVDVSIGLTVFSAAVAATAGVFLLSRDVGASRSDSALIAVLFSQLPYLYYSTLMIRGAFVEFLACCAYPLLLWSAIRTRSRGKRSAPWLALLIAVMLALHPPTALIAIPTTLALALAWRDGKHMAWLAAATIVGALIPAWYLSTALTHHVFAPHNAMFQTSTLRHSLFLRLSVLSDVRTDLGDRVLNTFSIANLLTLPAFLLTAAPILLICFWAARHRSSGAMSPLALIVPVVLVVILCHPWSMPIWETIPLLNRLQFAWRLTSTLSVLLPLALALLFAAWSVDHAFRERQRRRVALSAAVLTAINISFAVYLYPLPEEQGDYERARLDVVEHQLSGPVEEFVSEPLLFSPDSAQVDGVKFRAGRAQGNVTTPEQGATLVLRQFPYTGWRAEVDGIEVPLHQPDSGLVQIRVPAGRSRVEFSMIRTRFETMGIVASVLGTLLWAMLLLTAGRRVELRLCRMVRD